MPPDEPRAGCTSFERKPAVHIAALEPTLAGIRRGVASDQVKFTGIPVSHGGAGLGGEDRRYPSPQTVAIEHAPLQRASAA